MKKLPILARSASAHGWTLAVLTVALGLPLAAAGAQRVVLAEHFTNIG